LFEVAIPPPAHRASIFFTVKEERGSNSLLRGKVTGRVFGNPRKGRRIRGGMATHGRRGGEKREDYNGWRGPQEHPAQLAISGEEFVSIIFRGISYGLRL